MNSAFLQFRTHDFLSRGETGTEKGADGTVAEWFWEFLFYSFGGYLLEKWFAWRTGAGKKIRRCMLLPLCPVYGLGVTAVLAAPESWRTLPWLAVTGAVLTTGVEYVVHWAYGTILGVQFWNYSGLRGNLRGRVCLPFSLAWGVLTAAAVLLVQPFLAQLLIRIPPTVTFAVMLLVTADAVCSSRILTVTGDTEALHIKNLRHVQAR